MDRFLVDSFLSNDGNCVGEDGSTCCSTCISFHFGIRFYIQRIIMEKLLIDLFLGIKSNAQNQDVVLVENGF